MNLLYHAIQGYKNWQKYFHLSSFSREFKNDGWPTAYKGNGKSEWQFDIFLLFYYDSGIFGNKKTFKKIIKFYKRICGVINIKSRLGP